MKNLVFFLLLTTSFIKADVHHKEHELWWENSMDTHMPEFAGWLGDTHADSRLYLQNYLKQHSFSTMLDAPSGLCVDYYGIKEQNIPIAYHGLDITPKLVSRAHELGIDVTLGSIEKIPFPDSHFDFTYSRHILEHLDYYKQAVAELIRTAKKEVMITFFIKPSDAPDNISKAYHDGYVLYHNSYNKKDLEAYVTSLKKVNHITWHDINANEVALHIYLNDVAPPAKPEKRYKIGYCMTATSRYADYVDMLIESVRKHFLKNHDITFFVFSDRPVTTAPDVVQTAIEHKKWPYGTLLRFEYYYGAREQLAQMDYVFASDADMVFVQDVPDFILSTRIGTSHVGFMHHNRARYTYDENQLSKAYIAPHEGVIYYAGCFYGGTSAEFIKLITTTTHAIKDDIANHNYIARYHDESHLNRYFVDNPPTLILPASFCYHPDHDHRFPIKPILMNRHDFVEGKGL